ncbi:MAG: Enoyl-CoA hydratase [Conexibacter sp.]|jgi:enoyl-CoA hydratase/carnithine racemase|nr:Enoyl-CoA hydratase [Conexibacter sp.]
MPADTITYERRGAAAYITLDRPEKHNALDTDAWTALAEALTRARADAEARVVVLRGAGERAFSAGADLGELARRDAYDAYENALRLQGIAAQVAALRKPSIAALRGWAVGGGLELALGCTFRVASRTARVGLPEVNVGTLAGAGGTQRVTRLAPRGVALRMLLLGELLDAEAARDAGLVDFVVDDEALDAEVETLVERLTKVDPRTAALILDCVRLAEETSLTGGLAGEAALFGLTISYDAHREQIAGFMGKRA